MPFEQVEQKKRQYTDKYVVVDASRPELARFRDMVGQVKTVNMSGRALVEFSDYHLNIGWYDIDPDFLKIVDKPAPKVEKPAAKKAKPAAEAEAKPAAAAKPQVAKAPAAGAKAGKPSVAEILAAARAGKAGEAASAAGTSKAEAAPAAPKAEAPPPAAKPQAEAPPAEETAEAEQPVAEATPAPAAKSTQKVDKSKMTVADIIAWCRQHDAK